MLGGDRVKDDSGSYAVIRTTSAGNPVAKNQTLADPDMHASKLMNL